MKTIFAEEEIAYSGEQLRSRWIEERFGVEGDAAAAFLGRCDVEREWMVDLEDLADGSEIRAERMVHFIVEHFDVDIRKTVLRQRMLACLAAELLNEMRGGEEVRRRGDDLFVGEGKLSVSIATVSPVSGLIHFGVNVTTSGVPVKAASLGDIGVDAVTFARALLERYARETDEVEKATKKVRFVK